MTWDFPETNILGESVGGFYPIVRYVSECICKIHKTIYVGVSLQHEAQRDCGLQNIIISTDPPYYDNIGYADLSDFFYIWLRRSLKTIYPQLFRTMLVPKVEELVATPYCFEGSKEKAQEFFEDGMFKTCCQLYKYAREDVPVSIYYAYKQSESGESENDSRTASTGWETMLSAIIQAGFAITGTWPLRTEQAYRSVCMNTNVLASIVLVCRKRPEDAPSCTRRTFIRELKHELRIALKKLQSSNIAPVDMAQAAIGPGMGVFSRYAKVLEADGSAMTIRSALQTMNAELDVYFSEQDGVLDAESRFCVDLYTQFAFNTMKFGDADVLARAKNTSVEKLADMGLVYAEKGVVHLMERSDLPELAQRRTMAAKCLWLLTPYLARAMEQDGINGCAEIMLDFPAEAERARDLTYRLFSLAERKGWNGEAYAYNWLVAVWTEIQQQASTMREARRHAAQGILL